MLNSFFYVSWVSAASSGRSWILIWWGTTALFGPGSRRDPAPYIYSHKFAQLSPRSNTAWKETLPEAQRTQGIESITVSSLLRASLCGANKM